MWNPSSEHEGDGLVGTRNKMIDGRSNANKFRAH